MRDIKEIINTALRRSDITADEYTYAIEWVENNIHPAPEKPWTQWETKFCNSMNSDMEKDYEASGEFIDREYSVSKLDMKKLKAIHGDSKGSMIFNGDFGQYRLTTVEYE